MLTINFLRHFVEYHAFTTYIFIFLGVILEGEIVVILGGIFSHLGSINIFGAFLATALGAGTKSIFCYLVGNFLRKKHSHKKIMKRIENRIIYFLPQFQEKPFWSIFISRFFVFGLNTFSLVFSGYMNVKIKTYIKAELISLILWASGMLALGYFASFTALSVSHDIRKFLGIILLFFIIFFISQKLFVLLFDLFEDRYRNNNINKK